MTFLDLCQLGDKLSFGFTDFVGSILLLRCLTVMLSKCLRRDLPHARRDSRLSALG